MYVCVCVRLAGCIFFYHYTYCFSSCFPFWNLTWRGSCWAHSDIWLNLPHLPICLLPHYTFLKIFHLFLLISNTLSLFFPTPYLFLLLLPSLEWQDKKLHFAAQQFKLEEGVMFREGRTWNCTSYLCYISMVFLSYLAHLVRHQPIIDRLWIREVNEEGRDFSRMLLSVLAAIYSMECCETSARGSNRIFSAWTDLYKRCQVVLPCEQQCEALRGEATRENKRRSRKEWAATDNNKHAVKGTECDGNVGSLLENRLTGW